MNLIKCKTCKKILTSEEVKKHDFCDVESNDWKTIYASHFTTLENDDGERCIMIKGLDGVAYRIIEKKPNFVEYKPKIIFYQPKGNSSGSTADETEPEIMRKISRSSLKF